MRLRNKVRLGDVGEGDIPQKTIFLVWTCANELYFAIHRTIYLIINCSKRLKYFLRKFVDLFFS